MFSPVRNAALLRSAKPHLPAHRLRRRVRPPARSARRRRDRQRGLAALEFALVFPVLFLLVYGMLTYGLILVAQQSLTQGVAEGARAALRYSAGPVGAQACLAAQQAVSWLGGHTVCTPSAQTVCPYDSSKTARCLQVTLVYPYQDKPLLPRLPLIGLVTPTRLSAAAWVQLEPPYTPPQS